jgi:hypothetical protein
MNTLPPEARALIGIRVQPSVSEQKQMDAALGRAVLELQDARREEALARYELERVACLLQDAAVVLREVIANTLGPCLDRIKEIPVPENVVTALAKYHEAKGRQDALCAQIRTFGVNPSWMITMVR